MSADYRRRGSIIATIILAGPLIASCNENANQARPEEMYLISSSSLNCVVVCSINKEPAAFFNWTDTVTFTDEILIEGDNEIAFHAIYHGNDGFKGLGRIDITLHTQVGNELIKRLEMKQDMANGQVDWSWRLESDSGKKNDVYAGFEAVGLLTDADHQQIQKLVGLLARSLTNAKPDDLITYNIDLQIPAILNRSDKLQDVEIAESFLMKAGLRTVLVMRHPEIFNKEASWLVQSRDKSGFEMNLKHIVAAKRDGVWGILVPKEMEIGVEKVQREKY